MDFKKMYTLLNIIDVLPVQYRDNLHFLAHREHCITLTYCVLISII